jgi:phosphonoacetaldehyde hydrolase
MNNKIKGVIFDWAGTTVDYGCFAPVVTFMEVFKNAGIVLTLDEVKGPMGIHKKEHIKLLLQLDRVKNLWQEKYKRFPNQEDIDSLYASFEPMLISILKDFATPLPHVLETVNELKTMGIKIGSTTGYIRKMMDTLVPFAEKNGYVPDNIVTSDEVIRGRPHPFMCYKNAMDLDIYPLSSIIKVGDTIADIKEGINASMISIGVVLGSSLMGLTQKQADSLTEKELYDKIEEVEFKFLNAGANYVIKDMSYLIPLINELNESH